MHTISDKKKTINTVILAGVFLAYVVFNLILLMKHEQWRDEANVWLMARELSPVELFREIKYQGHPCLWYLLVMPFAKLGLPFQSIGLLSLSVMAVAAGLFLWKAPFHTLVKAVCVLSPVFTYFYADIARNYCLVALLLMLLAWYYPHRNEKSIRYGLLLGLLVQSDTIGIAPAGMISLIWLWENVSDSICHKNLLPIKRALKGIWIPLVSFLLWGAQFYQVSDSPAFQLSSYGLSEFVGEVRNYSFWILERLSGQGQGFCRWILILSILLLIAVSVRIRNIGAFCVMASAFLFEAVFSVLVYQLHFWHFIALCFAMLWTVWVLYAQRNERQLADDRISGLALGGIQVLVLIFAVAMGLQWNSEGERSNLDNALRGLYSDGVYTAEFMEENISPEEIIVSSNVAMASSVLAYLPKDYQFYFAGNGEPASYADYSESQHKQIGMEELLNWSREKFPEKEGFYLLDSGDSCIIDREKLEGYEILYRTGQETARGEEYTIYYVTMD